MLCAGSSLSAQHETRLKPTKTPWRHPEVDVTRLCSFLSRGAGCKFRETSAQKKPWRANRRGHKGASESSAPRERRGALW